jgi:hypothetical protein
MKKLLAMFFIMASIITIAKADDIDDVFNTGNGEFKFERFSTEGILLQIDKDAKIACTADGLCKLSSVTSDSKGWETSFNVGQGASTSSSGGTTIITGGYDSSSTCQTCTHWGITVTYKVNHCTQTVLVPRSLYYAMNRYMYGLLAENGDTKKGFTPADEAMIMFYTTIMKQATGCSGSK